MKFIKTFALILTIIGAINWGFVGLFNLDIIAYLFKDSIVSTILYILVGISGLIDIITIFDVNE